MNDDYLHKQWEKLTVYTTDGRPRIDNNLTENAVRPFVMGRKAWLFANSVAGANASVELILPGGNCKSERS